MKITFLGSEHHINATYNTIDNVERGMRLTGCKTLESSKTGEIITIEELKRVKGILSGLKNIDEMY